MVKTCSLCKASLPVNDFYPGKARCKQCINAKAQEWAKANRDKAKAATARWRAKNPEKVAEQNRRPRGYRYNSAKMKVGREQRLADPTYRARLNRQANERAKTIRRWLDAYKLDKGCVDCGFKRHPAALHFDHIKNDKSLNVCNAKSIRQAQGELAKCVVRCANCHAIKTWPHLLHRMSLEKSDL